MSVKKNFLYNVAYQVLTLVLPLVTAPYLSRVLGSEGLGTYSYSYSVAYYFVMFAMLGVNNYGNRSIATVRDDKAALSRTFWEIWGLQAGLGLAMAVVYGLYVVLGTGCSLTALVWVPYVLSAALDVNWLFFGLERFKVTVTRNFIVKLVTFGLTFAVVRGEGAVLNYIVLMSASLVVSVAALWPIVLRDFRFERPVASGVLRHLRPNLVLFVPVVAVSLYTTFDKVMLTWIAGESATGVFENGLKVAQMPFAFISALGTVMLPHAANLVSTGKKDQAVGYMAPSMWFAMLLSAAFTFGLAAISEEFVPVFFGPGFDECKVVLPLIVMEMPFMAWANVIRTQWLMPTHRDRAYVASVIVGAAVNLAVNLLLIPSLGATGAAVGTLAAEAAVCLVQTAAVRRDLPLGKWFLEAVPGLVIGLAMLAVIRATAGLLPAGALGLLLEILIGAAVFTVLSAAYYFGTKSPYLRQLLRGGVFQGLGLEFPWGAARRLNGWA